MTDTIPNVPRELLERAVRIPTKASVEENHAAIVDRGRAQSELRALLSAQSPAGVDGLEVVAWRIGFPNNTGYKVYEQRQPWAYEQYGVPSVIVYEVQELCRLSDAQAIIDGLRGEVADLRSMLATVSKAGLRVRTERDQQAQRIGELETALEFACKSLAQVTSSDGSGHADIAVSVLRMAGRKEADASQIVEAYMAGAKWRIDAALSAGKEGE